jgi:light-regulated signal transduction histidine kinase (bacteriophytochrome)
MEMENDILSLIGHKFRHDLIHMTDTMNLILAEAGSVLDEVHRSDLQQMKSDTARLLCLVDDILELARLEGLPSEYASFQHSTLLDQTLPSLARTANEAHCVLLVQTTPVQAVLFGNAELLQKALCKGIGILTQLQHQQCLCLSTEVSATTLIIRVGEMGNNSHLVALPVKDVFGRVEQPGILRDLLFCVRVARWFGGRLHVLGSANVQSPLALCFELPAVFEQS